MFCISFFGSVFTNKHLTEVPSLLDKFSGSSLSSLDVSIDIVWEKLCKLSLVGPDGCHPRVFREVKESLLQSYYFVNWSVAKTMEGCYSNTKNIFKKDRRILPTNYHPISLTSIVSKMLETIITEHIMNHFS